LAHRGDRTIDRLVAAHLRPRTERWLHHALGGKHDHDKDAEPKAASPDDPANR
jgi:hypothetical protein